jgi:hypothetical protein
VAFSSSYPGRLPEAVTLVGPEDGAVIDANGMVFSCEVSENAVGYQLLFGSDPDRVMDYSIISDTPNPPNEIIAELPSQQTWWTVRAYDQFGSTIYADPRLIMLQNKPPVAEAGPDMIIYAGLDGKANVTLDGSKSTDPDGDMLSYTWVWAIDANMYEANDVSLAIELPIGTHTVQLMVNDGRVDSQPDEVNVTVVAAAKGKLSIVPSIINRRGNQLNILVNIRLPYGIERKDIDSNEPLTLYPGGIKAKRHWIISCNERGHRFVSIFAFFDKNELMAAVPKNGVTKLKVAGKLKSGQYFYGCNTMWIIDWKRQLPWCQW